MKINCLACGHKVDLGNAYDDYKGQVKCWVCGTILEIRTHEGIVKSARLATTTVRPSAGLAAGNG